MIVPIALAIVLGLTLCAVIARLPTRRLRLAVSLVVLTVGAGWAILSHSNTAFALGMAMLGAGLGSLAPERPEHQKAPEPDDEPE
ncbi:hypothetical protein [Pseudomonas mangiferae]|uniref:Uncharacterized protein n=1 Tax=Pseudomonas mangiferae TaxID=2593654 RepID=A0A553GXB4_9PSED|nr:hypothetical protein [Pseudomonas mangiferae]TRX74144.1 hypothetical protein FM069_13495 [Pseudomonas mangiferae]